MNVEYYMQNNPPGRIHGRMLRRHRHLRDSLMSIMEPAIDNPGTSEIDVGRRLRELRTLKGLSIRSLAEMSGLNFNTLSLIENEKTSPSVSTLQQLAMALQVPITAFFESENHHPDVVYQKSGLRPKATFVHGGLEDMGNGLALGEGIPLLLTLEPGANSGPEAIVHTGQEFIYCLDGCFFYTVAGKEYILEQGDSLIFEATLTHRWENRGNTVSRLILILCPADVFDRSAEQHFMPYPIEK
jgi:transcriptional regulator with XRE-family HTH domain